MFNKVYDKFKKFIKENKIQILVFIVLIFLCTYKLPFYIDMPGGLLDTKDRVEIKDSYKQKGSFNMTYVTEMRATPIFYVFAKIKKDYDIYTEKELTYGSSMSVEDLYNFEKLLLKETANNAIIVGYTKANKEVEIKSEDVVVGLIYKEASTDLKIGDIIKSIDGKVIGTPSDLNKYLSTKKANDKIDILVLRDKKELHVSATLKKIDGEILIGIGVIYDKNIEVKPKVKLKFDDNESGPSGGLMTALTIYNSLIKEDLTHGYKIAGTGTIESDGTVGEISGVKYKLIGAVKNKATIFLVPSGDNYKEAIKIKKERNFDIKIVSISNFDEAVEYLKTIE